MGPGGARFPVVAGTRIPPRGNTGQAGDGLSGDFYRYHYGAPLGKVLFEVSTADATGVFRVAVFDSDPLTGNPTAVLLNTAVPIATTGIKEVPLGLTPTGAGFWIFGRLENNVSGRVLGNNNYGVATWDGVFLRGGTSGTGNIAPMMILDAEPNPSVWCDMRGWSWHPVFGFAW